MHYKHLLTDDPNNRNRRMFLLVDSVICPGVAMGILKGGGDTYVCATVLRIINDCV